MARTPSASAHEKVLEAAIQLIGERGIEGTSMDAIAQVSGVSKATVYKHWKDKETLCIDVIGSLSGPAARVSFRRHAARSGGLAHPPVASG